MNFKSDSSAEVRQVSGTACPAFPRALYVIVGVGVAIRLGLLLYYLSTHNWQGETWEYEEIANNLLAGRGLTYIFHNTVYRSWGVPLFPLVCYVLHIIGGPGLSLYYMFHLSVAAGIIGLTYLLARRLLGKMTALLAALLVALEPGLVIYHSYKVDPVALTMFLLLLGMHFFIVATEFRSRRFACCAGLSLGLGMLTRPDAVAGLGMLIVWGIWERKRPRVVLHLALPVLVAVAVVLTPWVLRNYYVHGQILVTNSVSSELLWRGNNPNSTGTSVTMSNIGQFEAAPVEFRMKIDTSREMEAHALFQEEVRRFILHDPVGFLWRFLQKTLYFWWFSPTYATNHYGWLSSSLVNAYKLLYAVLLGLATMGGWVVVTRGPALVRRHSGYLLMVVLGVGLIHSVGYVEGRHRVLVMPIILIWVAQGIASFRLVGCTLGALQRQ